LRSPYLVSRVLPRREAVASSAVEGTHSTLDELLTAEEADDAPNDATAQVRDYALALEGHLPEAARRGRAIFTEELVQGLHRAVMAADPHYADRPGEWRSRVVWIGGEGDISRSVFNPPPPAEVARCLADTLAYLRCEGGEDRNQHLVTRMAVAHAHFEAVHPFRDGNGRVGRLLMPLMMAAEAVPPLYLAPYVEAHKPAYMAALKAAQQRLAWHEIVGFFGDAVVATVEDLQAMRRALEALREAWAGRRRFRAGAASLRALDVVPSYPVLTVKRLAALLDVSIPTATAAVDQLVEAGVLTERTGYRRNRVFVAREVLAVLENKR
jgi:Fic family protein